MSSEEVVSLTTKWSYMVHGPIWVCNAYLLIFFLWEIYSLKNPWSFRHNKENFFSGLSIDKFICRRIDGLFYFVCFLKLDFDARYLKKRFLSLAIQLCWAEMIWCHISYCKFSPWQIESQRKIHEQLIFNWRGRYMNN